MTSDGNLYETTLMLTERIERLLKRQKVTNPRRRVLIALAGVPGSGKSTISSALLQLLPQYGIHDLAVLPMDGFHYTRATLSSFSDPDFAFRKRGAPFTFDVNAFLQHIETLRKSPVTACDEPELFFKAPSFDHAVGDPVPDAITITSRCRVVIIEGNYTLLNEKPWSRIADLVDERWFVDVPRDLVRERIVQRHLASGIETSREAAILRAEDNDLPNGDLIRSRLIEPDVRIIN